MTDRTSNLHNTEWPYYCVLGYTDEETVKLDFDNTSFKTARYWAARALKWFKLEGYIILKSSLNNYHVIFNRTVSWIENMHIVAWAALCCKNTKLQKYHELQCIKESSTLRVSPKREKASPRIVFRYGKEDGEINSFLKKRREMKNIIRKLKAD